jgi:hypothetical protein
MLNYLAADGISGASLDGCEESLEKIPSTRTMYLKIIKIKIRKLLHSNFCGGRMRAVQGLEDSARFSL